MIALVEGAARAEDAERDRADDPAHDADDHLRPRRHGASSRSRSTRARSSRSSCSSRCSSASSPRRSAHCSRPSASPAWTASCSTTSSRCRAVPSRQPATCRRCCSTRPAPSRSATVGRPSCSQPPGLADDEVTEAAYLSSLADETPEGRSIVELAARRSHARARDGASTRLPRDGRDLRGVHGTRPGCRGSTCPTARPCARAHPTRCAAGWPASAATCRQGCSPRSPASRAPAAPLSSSRRGGRAEHASGARRHPPQGRRQARHEGALRPAARHGHPHRHDHGRQPADGQVDRGRGRGRRLPRRGHARGQDGPHQEGAGGRPARRHDRRRHERRSGARPVATSASR